MQPFDFMAEDLAIRLLSYVCVVGAFIVTRRIAERLANHNFTGLCVATT